MPKKKVKADYWEEYIQGDYTCPYCGEDGTFYWETMDRKGQEICAHCGKVAIVEVPEKP